MRLLIKFPSRERPEKFFNAVENITSNIRTNDYLILASLDIDDKTMTTEGVKEMIKLNPKIKAIWGFSQNKIDAVNRDIWQIKDFDILLVMSDDMVFTKQYFDDEIFEAFADGFSGLVHFPDGYAGSQLCTMSIMTREYYEIFKYVYNTAYISVYADNEAHEVAIRLNKYRFINKNIIEHRHPIWGFGPADDLVKRNENRANYMKDCETFKRHQLNNFYL